MTAGTALFRRVLEAADGHERVKERLGLPFTAGPWYDSSVVIGRGGHTATVHIPLRGTAVASDVMVKVRGLATGVQAERRGAAGARGPRRGRCSAARVNVRGLPPPSPGCSRPSGGRC